MNNKTKRYQKKLQNFIILRYPQPQKFSSLSLSLSPSTKYLASRNHRDSNAPSRDPPIRQRAKVSTVERVKDQNPPFKIIQFACLKGKAERERAGANGTFAAASNVKCRMLASTDAYITSTWDDLAGGFQSGVDLVGWVDSLLC